MEYATFSQKRIYARDDSDYQINCYYLYIYIKSKVSVADFRKLIWQVYTNHGDRVINFEIFTSVLKNNPLVDL